MTSPSRHRLARTLYDSADQFENDLRRHDGSWLSGSPASQEVRQDQFAGTWGESPVRDAHESVLLHVHGTAEHLRSLGVALEHSPTVIPAFTLARGVLDQACDPWYRMEPSIGLEARIRRFMNAELKSHKELLNSLSSFKDSSAEAAQATTEAENRINAIKESAQKLGWEVRTPKKDQSPYPSYIVTEHKDGKTPSTGDLAADIAPGIGKLSWRLHSAVAHGVGYGLSMLLKTDGLGKGPVEQTQQQAAARYAVAPIAYMNLLWRVYQQFGWDRRKLAKLRDGVGEAWALESGITLVPLPEAFRA